MQIVGDQLHGVAAVLRLLVRAFDLDACTAVIGKHRYEAGEDDQADGDGYHQLDYGVAELSYQKHDVVPTVTAAAITRRYASFAPKVPWPQASAGVATVGFMPCQATETW